MTLPTTTFGTTDMEITRVGFGAWAIGGSDWQFGWGSQEDQDSIAAIRHAVERGINWIDTAAVYGLGHSEEIVRQAIAGLPDRPYVFTKCGLVWDPSDRSVAPRKIMHRVRQEVEDSLRRLGIDRIDLYQVHWPADGRPIGDAGSLAGVSPDAQPVDEYWQTMADLVKEGKVLAIGLSNHNVAELAVAEKIAHVDGIQPPFSALARQAAPEIAWARDNGTGVIAYSPMQSGLLTGAFSKERAASLPADDWRGTHPDFTTNLDRNLQVVDAMRTVAARHDVSVSSVAVAWVLAWSGVSGAIVGARRPAQVDDWIDAGSLVLTDQDLDEIAVAITSSGAGSGPARP